MPKAKGCRLDLLLNELRGQLSDTTLNHYESALKTFLDWAIVPRRLERR